MIAYVLWIAVIISVVGLSYIFFKNKDIFQSN